MKKTTGVIAVIVVLGAGYAGTTWYMGKRIQSEYERVIATANERMKEFAGIGQPASAPSLALTSYDRGFFSSEAVYTITATAEEGKPLEFRLHDHISHGPFPVTALKAGKPAPMLADITSQLVSTPSVQPWFDAVTNKNQPPLHAATYLGFSGTGQSVWTVEPASFSQDGVAIELSGGAFTIDLSNQYQNTDTKGKFGSVVAVDEEAGDTMRVANIEFAGTSEQAEEKSVRTHNRATVESVVIENPDKDTVTLKNLAMQVNGEQKGDLIDATVAYTFGSIQSGAAELGSISVNGELKRLDIKAFVDLGNTYDAMMVRQGVTSPDDLDLTPEDEAVLREKSLVLLKPNPLVTAGPIIWKNSSGQTEAMLSLDMVEPKDGDAAAGFDVLLPQIVKKADLNVSVSKSMMVQAFSQTGTDDAEREQLAAMGGMLYDQYVSRLQGLGFVSVQDDTAKLAIVYEKAMFNVNGKTMTPEEFMQRAIMLAM
ncbi:YdgA family protein [Pusillimonas sp. ANT_WB101]|uniref:YdgA family protein n=1 Tax=Pusillimonas sp. ANT_WB101 TaxID=2597356 RepID=UPI0011EE4D45|nr:YdgA family protein [Pusillimonas sp. ANT_WB101]KAA0910607.1 DUF945 domain-containing protein [Pusillimonas sp. ANT_WB101]